MTWDEVKGFLDHMRETCVEERQMYKEQARSRQAQLNFIFAVLSAFERAEVNDYLFWRVDGSEVRFYAMCNDVFWWATADAEDILADDIPLLYECLEAVKAIDKPYLLPEYFASRKRGMRPQIPWFKGLEPEVAELFNACGPERTPEDCG